MNNNLKSVLIVLLALTSLPVHAQEPRKSVNSEDITRQETVTLGDNRFIIFSGMANQKQYGYTADQVKIENGILHFDPPFT